MFFTVYSMGVVMLNGKVPETTSVSPQSLDAPGWPGGIAPAPLLPGEDQSDYNKLTARFLAAAKPRDFIEEILARDVIDLSWEVLRLRRLRAGLLRVACGEGVRSVAADLGFRSMGSLYDFAATWMSGDNATRKEFQQLLKRAGLGMEDVMAEALSSKIDTFERFDRMLASAEARRNNALREIDRHRETLGAAVRQAIDEVQDAEFQNVETGEVSGGPLT
ncbi:MAG: hypothetical protein JO223_04410 [Hyphomicrobiales bacterium]|nr:hypothetical protein [Hyphomicrobiales bacterium]